MNLDITKFSFKEMFNNSKGKTSLGLVICGLFGLAVFIGFVSCGIVIVFETHKEAATKADIGSYSMQCVALAALVIGYLTGRRLTDDKPIENNGTEIN
jgi:hypothetical protein